MRVLMCEPKYFRIGASDPNLNPHMNEKNQPDVALAHKQFSELCDIYRKLGIRVYFLRPEPDLFDQVFTANVAWGINKTFVMANIRPGWRKLEIPIAASWLASQRFNIRWLPENIFFEGQGDIITTKEAILYCYGIRNLAEAASELANIFNPAKKIFLLRLVSPDMYHGDLCLRYLGPEANKIIWCPDAFDEESNRRIENLKAEKLAVSRNLVAQELGKGRKNFPLNGIYYKNVCTFPWNELFGELPAVVRKFVEEDGCQIITHDFSEFSLSGGSHRCCTLFLD